MPLYHRVLRDYIQQYAIPAMLEQGWALKAAKSYGWEKAARGAEYHIDQPLRTHILNGLYALTRTLEYLDQKGYCHLSEGNFKRVLALYTLHDAYKDPDVSNATQGQSIFDVELQVLDDLYRRMHLDNFVVLTPADLRLASVSQLSPKVADLSSASSGTDFLLNFIHLADAFASQQTARDLTTAENCIHRIARGDAVLAKQDARLRKRIEVRTSELIPQPALKLYYHEIDDYRGLSTLMLHQCIAEVLDASGFYPLLYFANGILYIGPEQIDIDTQKVREQTVSLFFAKVRDEAQTERHTIAREACDARKGMKIEKYAYLFCDFRALLEAVCEQTPLKKTTGFLSKKVLPKRVTTGKYSHIEAFYERYAIEAATDKDDAHAQRWLAASKLMMAADNMAGELLQEDVLAWLFTTFSTPTNVATIIRQNIQTLRSGGIADHCYIIAYHWLRQARFLAEQRSWLEVDVTHIQQALVTTIAQALKKCEQTPYLLNFVEKELGFQRDITQYLNTSLVFSFDFQRILEESPLGKYEKTPKKTHKNICVICNRVINSSVSQKNRRIKTGIAEQQAMVFSNKRLATDLVGDDMMVWCPLCYLEFMLRKLSGQSYPEGSDYNSSYRLYLYVLPDYSFTPQLWEDTAHNLLQQFYQDKTVVSRLALRGSHEEPALPTRWLERRSVDQTWLEDIQHMFAYQAAHMQTPTADGKKRRYGDRITFSFKNPNYMLIPYDNAVAESADKGLTPTHSEVWTKAAYTASLIHLLTGARVYITDKPYLTIGRPEQMKTIIEMEGLHPLLYSLLPVRRTDMEFTTDEMRATESLARLPLATLPILLDLLAAVWEINAALYPRTPHELRNLDKQVASILEEIRANNLAGATLYKMRERNNHAYALFTRACQLLLPNYAHAKDEVRSTLYREGYELLLDREGENLMNLAQHITDVSLQLYIPSSKEKGRAHRFENLFRTGVEAMKIATPIDNDELISRVSGTMLKRIERIADAGGYCPTHGNERIQIVQKFAETLVQQLFYQRCGCSVSKLTHEENHLADAIYFLTAQKVHQYWEQQRIEKAKKVASDSSTEHE